MAPGFFVDFQRGIKDCICAKTNYKEVVLKRGRFMMKKMKDRRPDDRGLKS